MTRSARKGPFVQIDLLKKVERVKQSNKRDVITRSSTVLPEFVGMTFAVHDGKRHVAVFVTENMVGHRLGEFAPTRTFRVHSGQRKAAVAEKK